MRLKNTKIWTIRNWRLVLLFIFIIFGTYLTWEFFIDDAYIVFRYSKNLAEEGRIVWNSEDTDPVEGYTSFFWMLISAGAIKLNLNPLIFSRLLAMLALLGLIKLFLNNDIIKKSWVKFVLVAILVFTPATYININNGLETIFYSFLMLSLFFNTINFVYKKSDSFWKISFFGFLLSLTRPEGVLITLFSIAATLFFRQRERKRVVLSVLPFLILGAIYFFWRWQYFGYLMPNPFYLKLGNIVWGVGWTLITLSKISLILLTAAVCYFTIPKKGNFFLMSILFVLSATLIYPFSNLMMFFGSRFLYHFLPILLIVFGYSLESIFENMPLKVSDLKQKIIAVSIVILFAVNIGPIEDSLYIGLIGHNVKESYYYLGKTLNGLEIPKEYKTMATGIVGVIPYYAEWDCTDFIGFSSEPLTHRILNGYEFLKQRHPTLLFLGSNNNETPDNYQYYLTGYVDDTTNSLNYTKIGSIKTGLNNYFIVYIREDTPQSVKTKITDAINDVSEHTEKNVIDISHINGLKYYLNRLKM